MPEIIAILTFQNGFLVKEGEEEEEHWLEFDSCHDCVVFRLLHPQKKSACACVYVFYIRQKKKEAPELISFLFTSENRFQSSTDYQSNFK